MKYLLKAAACAALVLSLCVFASCGSDDDDDDGPSVVAKFADSGNARTMFFYDDSTFKVTETVSGAEAVVLRSAETVVLRGTYTGDPAKKVVLTVTESGTAGVAAGETVTVTVTDDGAMEPDDCDWFGAFEMLQGDLDDEVFYNVTALDDLVGTWSGVAEYTEEYEEWNYDDNGTKYTWTYTDTEKIYCEVLVEKNHAVTLKNKAGSWATEKCIFEDETAAESWAANMRDSIEEDVEEYGAEIIKETSTDSTWKIEVRYRDESGDVYSTETVTVDYAKLTATTEGKLVGDLTWSDDGEYRLNIEGGICWMEYHDNGWDQEEYFKINSAKNKIQMFDGDDGTYEATMTKK